MLDEALSVDLDGEVLKIHYPKLTVMHGVEHIVSLI